MENDVVDLGFLVLGRKKKQNGPTSNTGRNNLIGPYPEEEYREEDNTVPRVRCGVDWLQLMFYGVNLGPDDREALEVLKRSSSPDNPATFVNPYGRWEVADRGFGVASCHFHYVLRSNGLVVGISKRDFSGKGATPIATVTASGSFCCGKSFDQIVHEMETALKSLGLIINRATVTRLDLAADVEGLSMRDVMRRMGAAQMICRARRFSMDGVIGKGVESFYLGRKGADIRLNVYDKVAELMGDPMKMATYLERHRLKSLPDQMTRYEFRMNSTALRTRGVVEVKDLRLSLQSLFDYLTLEWYREAEGPVDRNNTQLMRLHDGYARWRESARVSLSGDREIVKVKRPVAVKSRLLAMAAGCLAGVCAHLGVIASDPVAAIQFLEPELKSLSDAFVLKNEKTTQRILTERNCIERSAKRRMEENELIFAEPINAELMMDRKT